MSTSSIATSSPQSETPKQKTTEANSSVFVSILARSFGLNNEDRSPGSFDNTVGNSVAKSFINMNDTDRALTLEFLNAAPKIARIFGYRLQLEIAHIDDSKEYIIRMLRNSRYSKLAEQVPQEISDSVRKEITTLEEGNENVRRGMAESRCNMDKDSFR